MLHNRGITGGQIDSRVLIRAASAVDEHGEVAPAAILLDGEGILQVGTPSTIGDVPDARIVEARDEVLLPGLVNAHCHLDLSGPGPIPFDGSFSHWLDQVLQLRGESTAESMAVSVNRGAELSLAGGTAFVGDIAGIPRQAQLEALRSGPLGGVCFPEFFGIGDQQQATIEEMAQCLLLAGTESGGVRCGLSPHAPYSCGPLVIEAAAVAGVAMTIHVAESPEEIQFLADGTGPIRELIQRRNAWNDGVVIPGCHPLDYVLDLLGHQPAVLVHLNYIQARHLDRLADSAVTVAYCPRASAYFGHPVAGVHPYNQMIERGIPVALGTDSLLCLDTPDRIGVLDEMRLLHRRDGAADDLLVRMATRTGAEALGIDPGLVDFRPGPIGGVMAVKGDGPEPRLVDALNSDHPPRWLVPPGSIGTAGAREGCEP